ncbi:MAG: hypothetical protein WBG46_06780 [Nonlabens sp.]
MDRWKAAFYSFELNFQFAYLDFHLVDRQLKSRTLIDPSQITAHPFNENLNNSGSFTIERFQLEFTTVMLTSGDTAFAKAVNIYSNPEN